MSFQRVLCIFFALVVSASARFFHHIQKNFNKVQKKAQGALHKTCKEAKKAGEQAAKVSKEGGKAVAQTWDKTVEFTDKNGMRDARILAQDTARFAVVQGVDKGLGAVCTAVGAPNAHKVVVQNTEKLVLAGERSAHALGHVCKDEEELAKEAINEAADLSMEGIRGGKAIQKMCHAGSHYLKGDTESAKDAMRSAGKAAVDDIKNTDIKTLML